MQEHQKNLQTDVHKKSSPRKVDKFEFLFFRYVHLGSLCCKKYITSFISLEQGKVSLTEIGMRLCTQFSAQHML